MLLMHALRVAFSCARTESRYRIREGKNMPKRPKPPRERAARALCSSMGLPENTSYKGRPMWENFLSEVDIVLQAALSPEEWERMKVEEPDS